ncbi:MAG: T9SS type A sorting domain-containing protein [Bacteroidota bacterium]
MKKKLPNLKTMVMILAVLFSGAANAFTAVTSGNWSSAATWGGVAPGPNVVAADIIIPVGITVTLDTDVTFTGLANTFSVAGTLSSSTNNKLTITQGALVGTGNIAIRKIVFSGVTTTAFSGTIAVNEMVNSIAALGFVGTANIGDSLILDAGSLTLNNNGSLSLLSGSTVKVNNGTLGVSGSGMLNTSNNYNVIYVGSSKTAGIELNGSTLQKLTVKLNNNAQSVTLTGTTTVNNALNVTTGMLNFSGSKLILKGDLIMGTGASLTSNATSDLIIEGTGALTSNLMFSAGSSIHNLTVNRATTVKLSSAQNISGTLNLLIGTLSLESGGSATMNSGSMVHVEGGNISSNTGTFTGTSSYNVEYIGTSSSAGGLELSGSGLNNVTVNLTGSGAVVTLNNNVVVGGNLNMMSGQMNLNARTITLNGTLLQNMNSSFIGNPSSEVNLNLTSATGSTLYFNNSTAANNTISKLRLNVAGAGAVALGSALMIKDELAFTSGKLLIDNGDLTIASGGTITGYNETRYVATTGTGFGRLKMNVAAGGSFVTFPVGTLANYSPAHIQQASAATSGNIMVKAMNDVLTAGYSGFSAGSMPVVHRTWFIDAETGVTVNMNLKLGWVAAAEVNSFNRNSAMIRHYTNNAWDTYTSGAATAGANTTFELTRTGITSLSPFAVADNTAPLKVGEISNTVAFEMFPNPAKDVIVLKVPSSSDAYKFEVIDITGKTISTNLQSGNAFKLNVSDLQPGCYFIKTTNTTDNSTGVKRFIKE